MKNGPQYVYPLVSSVTWLAGKSTLNGGFWLGKSSVHGGFAMAMFDDTGW